MILKRVFDLILATVGIVVFMPILLLFALLVLVFMGRPIFFKQYRPGLNAKVFTLFKFRTMSNAPLKADNNIDSDSLRITKLGAFMRTTSIDELPELFNVLKGDMSLVGPRPLLVEYLPLYTLEQARRHKVRPGITGLAQVSGRNALSWEDKFAFDIWYVDNHNLWIDIKIIWCTLSKVLAREGISAAGVSTMTRFSGAHNKRDNSQ